VVTNKSKLSQLSAPGGGYAVSIIEIKVKIRLKTSQTIYEVTNKLANLFLCNLYVVSKYYKIEERAV
jgi:hypothetical protein